MILILENLPKISLNEWYSSSHWNKRKKIKDAYKFIIRSQTKLLFEKNKKYNVSYSFFFKTKPLDNSNCVAMLKMIEDVLFEDDNYNIVKSIKITSNKSTRDFVKIEI